MPATWHPSRLLRSNEGVTLFQGSAPRQTRGHFVLVPFAVRNSAPATSLHKSLNCNVHEMAENHLSDLAVPRWTPLRTEPGYAGEIDAIEIWLIDWLISRTALWISGRRFPVTSLSLTSPGIQKFDWLTVWAYLFMTLFNPFLSLFTALSLEVV